MPPSQQGRWGYIVFGADSVAVAVDVHFFVSKQLVDFDQTCIYTYIDERRRVDMILVTLTLFSRSQGHLEMSKIWFSCCIFGSSGWILTKLADIHCWEDGKS